MNSLKFKNQSLTTSGTKQQKRPHKSSSHLQARKLIFRETKQYPDEKTQKGYDQRRKKGLPCPN